MVLGKVLLDLRIYVVLKEVEIKRGFIYGFKKCRNGTGRDLNIYL